MLGFEIRKVAGGPEVEKKSNEGAANPKSKVPFDSFSEFVRRITGSIF